MVRERAGNALEAAIAAAVTLTDRTFAEQAQDVFLGRDRPEEL